MGFVYGFIAGAISGAISGVIFYEGKKWYYTKKTPSREELQIIRNKMANSTAYRLQDLRAYIKKKEDEGIILDLDFHPRTNYLLLDETPHLKVAEIHNKFYDSHYTMRQHSQDITGITRSCLVELSPDDMLKLHLTHSTSHSYFGDPLPV